MEKRKRGRPRKFKKPAQLLEAAEQYFDWCDRNPWYKCEKTKDGDIIGVPIQRPYSIVGFCVFLGCSERFWWDLKNTAPPEFGETINKITSRIESQQFEGATVGVFNANIIARKLGLVDKKDVTTNGQNVTASPLNDLPTEALLEIEQIAKKYGK